MLRRSQDLMCSEPGAVPFVAGWALACASCEGHKTVGHLLLCFGILGELVPALRFQGLRPILSFWGFAAPSASILRLPTKTFSWDSGFAEQPWVLGFGVCHYFLSRFKRYFFRVLGLPASPFRV